MDRTEEFERAAMEAARRAGEHLRRGYEENEPIEVEKKGQHDFVTRMDRESETLVTGYLRERFPEHEIMAEEGSPELAEAEYRWVVDPLDGTTNFIHGVPTFAVSIGLEGPEGLLVGVVFEPIRDEMFHARRGAGAFLNGRRIRCSAPEGPGTALIATGFPFRELSRLGEYLEAFEAFVRSTAGLRRAGSAAIDLAYTACGRYDGFWEVGLSRWDVAAGTLLVREAGGTVTDVVGGDSTLATGDIVAAGETFHPRLLEVTKKAFG